jgi:hypothetical protein
MKSGGGGGEETDLLKLLKLMFVSRTCGAYGGEEKCIQGFSGKT